MASNSETPKECEVEDSATWQFNKSVTECNRHMLQHGIATDVTFLVSCYSADDAVSEAQTFSAHKYVLMSRSPVFYSMLCGDLAETGVITVTDIEPQAFRQMLNYIYTDDLKLSLAIVVHVINVSTKYLLPGLTSMCAEFIKKHLDTENVCTILDQILIFEQTDLNEICLAFIMNKTKKVLDSESIISISREAWSKILDINTCEVREVDLFKACLKWARQKCDEDKKEATGINVRKVLGECVKKFRFTNITDFSTEVCPTEVFTKDEEHGIICHLANKQAFTAPDWFASTTRLRPVYSVITVEEIQPRDFQKLYFNVSIDSYKNTAINVNTLLIGKKPLPSCNTSYSIKHNDMSVTGTFSDAEGNMIRFQCDSPLIIKTGSSALQISYQEKRVFRRMPSTSVTSGNVYGVPKSNITLQDGERISLKMSDSDNNFIPLLGLTYQLVLD